MRKRWLSIGGGVLVVALAAAAVLAFSGLGREAALAELHLTGLTCGSCAGKVKDALSTLSGVGSVEVSVTSGRAMIEFEPDAIGADAIAARITAAGYPARVAEVLSPAEVRALREDTARLAEKYVARVGDRLVSRTDFTADLARLRAGVPEGQIIPEARLQQLAWQETVQRALLIDDAERGGIVVPDGEVALEIDRMRQGVQDFAGMIAARFGSEESFIRRVKDQMIIQRHIEDNVVRDEVDPHRRQAIIEDWYRGLVDSNPVTIFDPALKGAVEKSGGCGGSCCG